MDITYNIISLIDILGFVQGIVLGILLIANYNKKEKSTFILGVFIICYALELLIAITEELNIIGIFPELYLLPFSFTWLLPALFYLYAHSVSILSKTPINYKILWPGIIVFIIDCVIFFQSYETKQLIDESDWYNILNTVGFLYSIIILVKLLKFLKNHSKEIKNQYSSLEYKKLRWIRLYAQITFIYSSCFILLSFFEFNYYLYLIFSIVNVILLYWISLRGILQQNVTPLIPISTNKSHKEISKEAQEKNDKDSKQLFAKLNNCIISENIFTIPDLTIMDIADRMNIHPKRISEIINANFNQNFNSYINNFRVEKAKSLLLSELSENFSIEGIGKEVGFQSKTTFYNAFKKITGTTPLGYKNGNL